ncbi:hypothetical protein [Metabacillus arenae]|uniref:Uncharacterized protein n=1 Tax=Metabacillus arenae TaxID=2771434 RepID=A0A926NKQ7_9BACI|nr:hypothetical protein [Metabacillus arenae]MBD1382393.1 hypothetical protein [Metabacillus arenae]
MKNWLNKNLSGLSIYMVNEHQLGLLVTVRNGIKVVLLRKNVADIQTKVIAVSQDTVEIYLKITGDE